MNAAYLIELCDRMLKAETEAEYKVAEAVWTMVIAAASPELIAEAYAIA